MLLVLLQCCLSLALAQTELRPPEQSISNPYWLYRQKFKNYLAKYPEKMPTFRDYLDMLAEDRLVEEISPPKLNTTHSLGSQAQNWARELGTPLYVLERPLLVSGERWGKLWEIRPSERNAALTSGSRLLLSVKDRWIKSYGLVGLSMDDEHINPGRMLFLDDQDRLWIADLDSDPTYRSGAANFHVLPGNYARLEASADNTLFALNKQGQLVEIDQQGLIHPLSSDLFHDVLDFYRKTSGDRLILLTKKRRLLVLSTDGSKIDQSIQLPAGVESAYLGPDAAWYRNPELNQLTRLDLATGKSQSIDLSSFQAPDYQGGLSFQFMGMEGETLYARVGNHALAFTPTAPSQSRLSGRLVAPDFFGTGLRPYGVNYNAFAEILVVWPRQLERTGKRRADYTTTSISLPTSPVSAPAPTLCYVEMPSSNEIKNTINQKLQSLQGSFVTIDEYFRHSPGFWQVLDDLNTRQKTLDELKSGQVAPAAPLPRDINPTLDKFIDAVVHPREDSCWAPFTAPQPRKILP